MSLLDKMLLGLPILAIVVAIMMWGDAGHSAYKRKNK